MAQLMEEYREKKTELLEMFKKLDESGFVPYEKEEGITVTEEQIGEYRNNLEDELFYISVCGQIKAGKSTLLNCLLFDNEKVLSAGDAPCTASLTRIKYSPEKYVRAHFYDEEEWKKLRNIEVTDGNGAKVSYFDEYLKEFVEQSQGNGVYAQEVIGNPPHEMKHYDGIDDYAAKKGKYNPFVSYIDIGVDNDFIKDVIVVDTPGTNDPNKLREKITLEWVGKSSAVIMLLLAGQALDSSDLKFIDKYLRSIEQIVFGLSKADQNEYQVAKNYVEQKLRNLPALKERHLLDEDKEVYPISAMASIIHEKEENDRQLTADEKTYKEIISNTGPEAIEENGYMDNFIKAVNNYIMKDKGKRILNTAANQITGICEDKLFNLQDDLAGIKEELENWTLDMDELDEKIAAYSDTTEKIEDIREKYEHIRETVIVEIKNAISGKVQNLRADMQNKFNSWLKKQEDASKVLRLAHYQADHYLRQEYNSRLPNLFKENSGERLKEIQKNLKRELMSETENSLSVKLDYIFTPTINLRDSLKKLTSEIGPLKKENNEELKVSRLFLLTNHDATKDQVKNEFNSICNKIVDKTLGVVEKEIDAQVDKNFTKLYDKVQEVITSYKVKVNNIKNNLSEREEKMEKLKNDKKRITDKKNELEAEFNNIRQQIQEMRL